MLKLDPKIIADSNRQCVQKDVAQLQGEGINPHLNVLLIGDNESAKVYSRVKKRIGESLGIIVSIDTFGEASSQSEVTDKILQQNNNPDVHGILIESPVPTHMNYEQLINKVSPLKDVDGLTTLNLGKILSKRSDGILPATPLACISILEQLTEKIEGLRVVIVGHGKTVGGPLSNILSNMGATVVSCNHHTKDLGSECMGADVIITATGVPKLIKDSFVNENTIIIDAGISVDSEGNISGDVDYENVSQVAKYVSPVPGGVGPVTTSILFKNLIKAIHLQKNEYDPFGISLNDFIALSRGSGMPGGGGIASVTAINAITMISMVYTLTKGIEKSAYEPKVDNILYSLKTLYLADIAGFGSYLKALKLPKTSQEEKIYRANAIEQASIESCLVPIKIARLCLEILSIAKDCYRIGNKNVLTDVVVGVNLAIAAAKSSLEPIELNLSNISDQNLKISILREKGEILSVINNFSLQN